MMQRIGVTGAFGFLGANFVSALLASREALGRETEVIAYASRGRSNPLFDAGRVRLESLDIFDREGMARKFEGLDALVHFAGRVDFRASAKREVWDTDALGAVGTFDAALAAGLPRLLYVSSICALGAPPAGALADESSSPYGDPSWPGAFASATEALDALASSAKGDYGFLKRSRVAYFDAKLAGWEAAKLYARERGLGLVTIFPGTAVGGGDIHRSISRLVDGAWEGRLPLSFGGATSFVAARDLGAGALLALDKGRAGEGYVISGRDEHNLGYPEFQDLVAGLARREGGKAALHPAVLPKPLLLAAASAAEALAPRAGLARALVLSGSVRNVCSSAKARSELGYQSAASLEEAILECRRFGKGPTRRP
jgi:dihydroflavonol-4-reductase